MNLKSLIYLLLLVLFPWSLGFSSVLELPLNSKNKPLYYLDKSELTPRGVLITSTDNLLDSLDHSDHTLITFEHPEPGFHKITLVNDAVAQKKSGLFFNRESYVEVPFDLSLENGLILDFWAKPLSTLHGGLVYIRYLSKEGLTKGIFVSFERGRVKIQFLNMFSNNTEIKNSKTVTLFSNAKILPEKWEHHRIVFTPSSGRLTYYNNGKIDNETWATRSFLPGSSTLFFNIPKYQQVLLGSDYRGLLDQFIIGNNPAEPLPDEQIGYPDANIYTRTLALPERSRVDSINIDSIMPTDTAFSIFYRVSETPFNDDTPDEVIHWQEYNDLHPQKTPHIVGRYIQLRLHMIADPTKNYSPLIRKINIHYSPFETPLKPLDFRAFSSNGDLILSLRQSLSESIAAYRVYIGTQPDSFFGDPENNLESPIIIPITNFESDQETKRLSYKISGLTPMKLYYIKITAVTTDGIESSFSDTVKCRVRALP